MRIALDSQIFAMQEYGGVSRYFCNLARCLSSRPTVDLKIFAPLHINSYLSALPPKLVFGRHVPIAAKQHKLTHALNLALSCSPIRRFKPEIVHHTYYFPWTCAPKGARRVVTVHDMIHERFSTMFPMNSRLSTWKKQAVLQADHVICISESTRRDLLEMFNLCSDKVSVIHLGFDRLADPRDLLNQELQPGCLPYILYVGERAGYKNFSGFLRAFGSSSWLRQNFGVICFGGGLLRSDELRLISELGIPEHQVSQTGGGDGRLAVHYRNAAAFVYPSLYEGFGIPPLEAMSLDCPVICSNTSSLPEVLGAAAAYFDPHDTDSIRLALEKTLGSSERRHELIELGRERYTRFTWELCTDSTIERYSSLS
ncbi:MAG: glycosyltransferase family 4 protein [Porticoccaceae bacterium]